MSKSRKKTLASLVDNDGVESGGKRQAKAGGTECILTTNQGLPLSDNQNSLHTSPNGPILLEDFILREKITHFDHERIPERIVHARGTGAHGYFELKESLADYTTARVLTEVGMHTPVFARFSTVAGGAGSADTPRDVRGFAVKFYTSEGNWDLVGNNVPVFFIQDAIKFPDLVHALKMEPDRGFPQAASAHDTFWDFISLMPESMHMVMWAMSDRTLPRSLRMMDGFGVHSFRLVNASGESTFVKFHWRAALGVQSMVWDEAVRTAGADPDFHRRDLWDAIQSGDFPEWELSVQLFTEEQAQEFPFDHLDPTKLIPEELVPLLPIGRMVLDRMPDNFFAETEQVAFCPANIVPGIDFSNDPLLQGRLFSYQDTQLLRLGSPNFHQLPINLARCPVNNNQRDGRMQMQVPTGRVNYEPNSLGGRSPKETAAGFRTFPEAQPNSSSNSKGRIRPESFTDHFSQATMFYRSQSAPEQSHIVSALVFELSKVETPEIRCRAVGCLHQIDEDLAARVSHGIGLTGVPQSLKSSAGIIEYPTFSSLQLINERQRTLRGRCIGIMISDGSDHSLLATIRSEIQHAGASSRIVAPRIGKTKLSNGVQIVADGQLAGHPSVFFDAIVVLLTIEAATLLTREASATSFVRDAYTHLKAIAVDVGGRILLDATGCEADESVVGLNSENANAIRQFLSAAETRLWSRESAIRSMP